MMSAKRILTALILLTAGSAFASGDVSFEKPIAITATPTLGSAYVILTSPQDDTLTGFSSPCCDAVELHSMHMSNDAMQMRKMDVLAVKANAPVNIVENHGGMDSMHLMLIGLHREFTAGQRFPITFTFAKQGKKTADFTVTRRTRE